jgi:hypothetical protein
MSEVGVGVRVQTRRKWFMDDRENNILAEALQTSKPEERRAWMKRVFAGDDDLRREVESLVKAYEQAGNLFDHTMPLRAPDYVESAYPDIQTADLEKQTVGGEPREGRFSGVLTWSFWRAQRSDMKGFKLGNCLSRYTDGSLYSHRWP